MRRILIIDEGSPGHLTQSRGLATALAARLDADVDIYPVRLTLRGIFRPLLKFATSLARRGLPHWILQLAYTHAGNIDDLQADVIVTSGGRGLYFATSLARRLGCPLVFCGDPAPLPASWCDVILSPVPIPHHAKVVETELLITEFSSLPVSAQAGIYQQACSQSGGTCLGVLLVGGDSRSHRYTREDWDGLVRGINLLGEHGWRWLVSSSRRTPAAVEERLRAGLNARYVVKAVWWHAQPERVMHDYLGAADCVLVTQDSLSMLSEAIAAGKPAMSLVPRSVRPSAFIESVLSVQEKRRRLRRLPMSGLGSAMPDVNEFALLQENLLERYAASTERMLGIEAKVEA